MVTISFPGLGIGEFTVNKVAISVGKLEVRWYGILIVLGIIAAFTYATLRAKKYSVSFDDMLDVTVYTVITGIVGARLYYVLSELDHYNSFWDVFKIWEGGLGIYGGIIGGAIAMFIVCRIKKINIAAVFDCAGPGVMLAQAIGRWGNFFNGEAYGKAPAEGSFLYLFRMTVKQEYWYAAELCQPCFLYECLWNLLGFALINIFLKKKKFNGQIFFEYLAWYGFGRFFIETQRTDSLYIGSTNIRKSMLVAALCVLAAVGLTVYGILKARKTEKLSFGYADVFGPLFAGSQVSLKEEDKAEEEISEESTEGDIPEEEQEPDGQDSESDDAGDDSGEE